MFKVSTHNKSFKADFFVQSKGNNAGKPMKQPTANCFDVVVTETEILLPEYLYYVVYAAYSAGAFKKHIRGSVVPFITIEDFNKALLEFMAG